MKYKTIVLRIPISVYAELSVLEPGIISSDGQTKYGGISKFFLSLLLDRLALRRKELQKQGGQL